MIKKLILNNFLSHTKTTLDFHPGITVFVGHNGSGKSSIIDSITFALFDEHTRKSNKNLLSRGFEGFINNESGSYVIMDFSVGSNHYRVQRQIDSQGRLVSAKLDQMIKEEKRSKTIVGNERGYRQVISGERKQLGESVIKEVEKVLDMSYTKLQIAGIIQQGEMSKIIDSQPREFKELLNNMIGLDRLDNSHLHMHGIIEEFRKSLRNKTGGYDDNHLDGLNLKIKDNKSKILKSRQLLDDVMVKVSNVAKELSKLDNEIEVLEPKIIKLSELKSLENLLANYFKERSRSLKVEIDKLGRMINEVENALDVLENKDEVLITIQMVSSEKDDVNKKLTDISGEIGKLEGLTECASKLQIKDGKCPVCNSNILFLNQMFDVGHIATELKQKIHLKSKMSSELSNLNREELDLKKKERAIVAAERTIQNYDYNPSVQINSLKDKLYKLEKDFQTVHDLVPESLDKVELSAYKVDEYSSDLIDKIANLRDDVVDVDSNLFQQKKITKNKVSNDLIELHKDRAVLEKTIIDLEKETSLTDSLISKIESVSRFIDDLEKIRSRVFNRDGIVSSSLRTFAMNLISLKASEYIQIFNVGLSRISLIEKPREIKIVCYGKRGEVDTVSLSGGEKVAVSLAIRLGISFLMGSSKTDFIILDEPTANLDEERRKTFVKIISDVFNKGTSPLNQLIIITHDEEIFENSEIEQVYKFEMTERGSSVKGI
ncbi:MAG: SMC family ATPase [Candidatus Nitrosocosmicus sp.]|nr:SMC family ATPase [Candidatus Nitrosocosmicus sp.]